MKKVFVVIAVVAVLTSIVGYNLATGSGSSEDLGISDTHSESKVEDLPYAEDERQDLELDTDTEPTVPTTKAEQVLSEISDAGVQEGTEDLNRTFNCLSELCETAIKTRDAMLRAKYDSSQNRTANDAKGTENDGE